MKVNNNWKEIYHDHLGRNLESEANPDIPTSFFSINGINGGQGTRDNPKNALLERISNLPGKGVTKAILSGGYFDNIKVDVGIHQTYIIVGSGMFHTSAKIIEPQHNTFGHIKDMTIRDCSAHHSTKMFVSCIISGSIKGSLTVRNSIIRYNNPIQTGISNSYIDLNIDGSESLKHNLNLFERCNLSITAANINYYKHNYQAFDNCQFKIGLEDSYTPLTGENETELRENFDQRCKAQNISLPIVEDYGESLKIGRWIFTKNNAKNGKTLNDSEIEKFAKTRNIYFGYSNNACEIVPITSDDSVPQSFSPSNPMQQIKIDDQSIALSPGVDLSMRDVNYIDSKIIWLKGQHRLSNITLIENLPTDIGVSIGNGSSFGEVVKSGSIEADKNYIVRSSDNNPASIMYNGSEYNTSLVEGANIFRGELNINKFETLDGNPEILEIIDYSNHKTIQLRVVNEIPNVKITEGTLQQGYWYFVTPNNLDDVSGTITYKGKKRSCFDSFIADGDLKFGVQGNCHLRRCWRQDYSEKTEITDTSFWEQRQKPLYFDVLPDDMRCLRKNNSTYNKEMQKDSEGKYIASGNPEFYKRIDLNAGRRIPYFDIEGSFIQIRIPISTMNPM